MCEKIKCYLDYIASCSTLNGVLNCRTWYGAELHSAGEEYIYNHVALEALLRIDIEAAMQSEDCLITDYLTMSELWGIRWHHLSNKMSYLKILQLFSLPYPSLDEYAKFVAL